MDSTRLSAEQFIRRTAVAEFVAAALSLFLSLVQLSERTALPLAEAVYLAVAQAAYGVWLLQLRRRYTRAGWVPSLSRSFTVALGTPGALGVLGLVLLMLRYPHDGNGVATALVLSVALLVIGSTAAMLCVFRADTEAKSTRERSQ